MPCFAESDLVLHCLLMSHKKDARLKWVKVVLKLAERNLRSFLGQIRN